MSTLETIVKEASDFVESEFGFDIEKSVLKPYSSSMWEEFCKVNGFDYLSEGIYIPSSYSAYVKTDTPFLVPNVFHELYGHGLFFEHSMKNEEAEGFAIWLEGLISKETGHGKDWNLKRNFLGNGYSEIYEKFCDYENKLSRLGFLGEMGLPKFYDVDNVSELFEKIYPLEDVDFAVLYGSRKPYSDIDLFVVSSNESRNLSNDWLDIYEVNREDFSDWLEKLDISVTDPLFSGEVVYGSFDYVSALCDLVLNMPITSEAISHNYSESERCVGSDYSDSFYRNALELSCGRKCLTLDGLSE